MNQPLISVIIPAYNAVQTLPTVLNSVRAQTYHDYEIIVVDDGSNDGTADFLTQQPDVRYIHQENQGVSAARNRGAAEAQGEYLAFLDADDLWHPQKLDIQMNIARHLPGFGLLGTEIKAVKTIAEPIVFGDYLKIPRVKKYNFYQLLHLLECFPSSALIPKIQYYDLGGFSRYWTVSEDRDMWQRIAYHYPYYKIPLPLTIRYQRPNSLSGGNRLYPLIYNTLIVEQWNIRRPNSLDMDHKIKYGKFIRIFRIVIKQYGREILKYYPREVFEKYWRRFEYAFGPWRQVVYNYFIIRNLIKYRFRQIPKRDFSPEMLERLQ
jgi:glycosyltransferase involved in cell wall biosynthesis